MNDLDNLNELGIGHKSIKIRLFYITFFFLFLVIGIVITQNVEGSVLSIFGLFIARLIVNFFYRNSYKKTKKEKEEDNKKNSKERFEKMFENNSNTFGSHGL
tara:strand:+ start:229 stop:534 length:306 start_codon:yes stop_codon:yes gene_type:complete